MALSIVKVTSDAVRVRISTLCEPQGRDWTIDRRKYGSIGAIRATDDKGDRCTLGMFRTRDGAQMQPDYAKLRSLLKAA